MSKEIVVAADIGTSSCKTSLVETSGTVLGTHHSEYRSILGQPGFVEQDPEDWWQAFVNNTRALLNENHIDPDRVLAVSVSGITPIALPVDQGGIPLRNAIIYQDRRCESECEWLRENQAVVDIEHITTNRIDPSFTLPKLLWLKRNEIDTFQNAYMFLQSNGYIVFKLTQCWSMDITHAGLTQLFDMHGQKWSDDICDLIELEMSKLPRIYRSYEIVGSVTDEAATETGLAKGTPVVAGCNDTAASSIGAGLIYPGKSFLVMGTAGAVGVCSDILPTNPALYNYDYLFPGTWFSIAPMAACGASFRWAKENLFCSRLSGSTASSDESYAEMNQAIESTTIGSGGVLYLPYLAGERSPIWDSTARGVFFGLNLATTQADMMRSIMEGTAFAIFQNVKIMEESGIQVGDFINSGGGAKSRIWNQIVADVTDKTIHTVKTDETVTLGDAIVAAYGLNVFNDNTIAEQIEALVSLNESFYPNPKNRETYLDLFYLFKKIYQDLKSDFVLLDEINREIGKKVP